MQSPWLDAPKPNMFRGVRFSEYNDRFAFHIRTPIRHWRTATPEVIVHNGGGTAVAYDLYKRRAEGGASFNKIGVMIAGNSGRPGGSVGYIGQTPMPAPVEGRIRATYRVQEEDMVSNWLQTTKFYDPDIDLDRYFSTAIGGLWGLEDPFLRRGQPKALHTVQGIDYTRANHYHYGDAWVVSPKAAADEHNRGKPDHLKLHEAAFYPVRLSNKKIYVAYDGTVEPMFANTEEFECDLVFVAGPNAMEKEKVLRNPQGSVARTWNEDMTKNYNNFRLGVMCALRAGLDAMIKTNCDVAIVALVSGGIYAGKRQPFTIHFLLCFLLRNSFQVKVKVRNDF